MLPPVLTSFLPIFWFILLQAGHLSFPNQGNPNSSEDLELSQADLNKLHGDGKSIKKVDKLQLLQSLSLPEVSFHAFIKLFHSAVFSGEKFASVSAAHLMPVASLVPALPVQQSGDTQWTASGSWCGCRVSDAESSAHSITVLAALIAASWWFILHILLPSGCLSISFTGILEINLSIVPSDRTGWGQGLYIFHASKCKGFSLTILECLEFSTSKYVWVYLV